MEINYKLTPDDIWRFAHYSYRHKSNLHPVLRAVFLAIVGLVLFGDLLIVGTSWHKTGQIQGFLLLLLAGGFWFLSRLLPPTRSRIAKVVRKQPEFLAPTHVSISPDWLSAQTTLSEAKYSWQKVHSVEEDTENFYLFVSKTNAHIIPKRAFTSLAQAQAFLDRARLYWNAAKTGQAISEDAAVEDTGVWPPPPRPLADEETTG